VRFEIFDVLGRRVVTLLDGFIADGVHSFAWDARDSEGMYVASGVYFARLTARGGMMTRKLVLLK
jgi:flagellar hook assembly protein FlgD